MLIVGLGCWSWELCASEGLRSFAMVLCELLRILYQSGSKFAVRAFVPMLRRDRVEDIYLVLPRHHEILSFQIMIKLLPLISRSGISSQILQLPVVVLRKWLSGGRHRESRPAKRAIVTTHHPPPNRPPSTGPAQNSLENLWPSALASG